jgi:hypothetical protein
MKEEPNDCDFSSEIPLLAVFIRIWYSKGADYQNQRGQSKLIQASALLCSDLN